MCGIFLKCIGCNRNIASVKSLAGTVSDSVFRNDFFFGVTILLMYFNLVFGELVPKRIALQKRRLSVFLRYSRFIRFQKYYRRLLSYFLYQPMHFYI